MAEEWSVTRAFLIGAALGVGVAANAFISGSFAWDGNSTKLAMFLFLTVVLTPALFVGGARWLNSQAAQKRRRIRR
jgi:ABC-type transport system involved in cytochrome bd biosynthesis fused ATPase/permease subunit